MPDDGSHAEQPRGENKMKLTDIFTHTSEGIYEADVKGYHIVAVTTRFDKSLINIAFE